MASRWWPWGGRSDRARLRVLTLCTGNICRSPTAEAVLRTELQRLGVGDEVLVDSAGTQGFHRGHPPDPRAVQRAAARGYDLQGLKARVLVEADFERFDRLYAMDDDHLLEMRRRCPPDHQAKLAKLLGWQQADGSGEDVPDPYYGSLADFDLVLDLLEPVCRDLARDLQQAIRGNPAET